MACDPNSHSQDGEVDFVAAKGSYTISAAGFNGHGQLSDNPSHELRKFQLIYKEEGHIPKILFASWSTTTILGGTRITNFGHQKFTQSIPGKNAVFISGFGDHNGAIGLLDHEGHLYLVKQQYDGVYHIDESHEIDLCPLHHVAKAGNDRVVAIIERSQQGECEALEFRNESAFRHWCVDTETASIDKVHKLPNKPKQLLANTGSFIVLMENDEVYTWGDSRYRSLGRAVSGNDATPRDSPGFVEALGGLKIIKIASGGWMSAAISEDGAAYFWGTTTPGRSDTIKCLREADAGNAALIELPGGDDSEPLDVLDIAIGENHAIALTENNRIFVVGENQNGQLGLGSDISFISDWQEIPCSGKAISVACGPKTSFILTHQSPT